MAQSKIRRLKSSFSVQKSWISAAQIMIYTPDMPMDERPMPIDGHPLALDAATLIFDGHPSSLVAYRTMFDEAAWALECGQLVKTVSSGAIRGQAGQSVCSPRKRFIRVASAYWKAALSSS